MRIKLLARVAAAAVALSPCAPALAAAPVPAAAQSDDARLAGFFQQAFLELARMSPESLTFLGMKDRYGELDEHTFAAQTRWQATAEALLARMKREFEPARLSEASRLSYRLFEEQVANNRWRVKWYWHDYAVTSTGGALDNVPVLLINNHRVSSVADAEAYVSRIRAVAQAAEQVSAELATRTQRGFLPPAFVFGRVIPDARNQITGAPFDGGPDQAVWADFKGKVAALTADESTKARLLAAGEAALRTEWRAGYERYIAALEAMSRRATRVDGVWALQDGARYYADLIAYHTTTDLTPDQVHRLGLAEVARIRREMERVKDRTGFRGGLDAFMAHVRTSPQFHYPNTEAGRQQYLADAKAIVAGYMAVADRQFSTLPRQALEVRAVEPFREKTAAVAFYAQGAPDGSRPGIFYVNLSDMSQVLKPQLEALAFHEGAPGHHFQIARSLEQRGLPLFRRVTAYNAYTEGWGLYAEGLGKEAGFYRDPYSDFGRLSLELWRAARLVLDTGIHAKRWSRAQAVAYMRRNTLNSDRDVESEVDRYFTQPGQALSYKIGQLKISELRAHAERALGPRFDVRAYHEAVLAEGALPLDVLEAQVDAYIARTLARGESRDSTAR